MSNEVVVPEVLENEDDSAADFEAGFSGTPTEVIPPVAEEVVEPAVVEPPPEVVPEVKYRQFTEKEWEDYQASITAKVDQGFGKVGGLERTIRELQAATPKGYEVEVTDDIVADLQAEFPEIAGLTLKAIKTFASKLKGTATAPAAVDPEEFNTRVSTTVAGRVRELATEDLEDAHPDWREIVGSKDSDVPFRKWLATQPAEYSQKLNSTESSGVIARAIDRFKASQKAAPAPNNPPAPAAPSARQQRLAAAVVTKGVGGSPPGPSEDDEFNAGFNSR